MRIWMDTDLGTDVDDALALAYALRHPDIELVGISTVFGDVVLRTRMVEALLEIAGVRGIPVVTGLGKPLSSGRPGVMFGHEGLGLLEGGMPLSRVDEEPERAGRIDALAGALADASPEVILAIGPLTNLGALAEAGAPLPRLAIMGGKLEAVELEGMVPAIEEWNWYCDPLAVQHVLSAPHVRPPRVVPAEITFQSALASGDVGRLAGGDPLCQVLARLSAEWLTAQREKLRVRTPRVLLHDPLTLATLVETDLCRFEPRKIRVDDEGRTTCGEGEMVEAAVDLQVAATREHLMAIILGG